MVKISIVMPNRDAGGYLEQAIRSVLLAGEAVNLEYIVVDGASTDGSAAVIQKYSERLSFWSSEPDQGQYDAVNKGFARSTGELLGWLNSDDIYFPWTLETVASVFTELPEVDWLTTASPGAFDADGLFVRFRTVPGYAAEAFFENRYTPVNNGYSYGAIQQESTFFRRSLWERAGGKLDCSYDLAADFELWSRFFQHATLYCIETPLAAYRQRPNQRGANISRYMTEVSRCLTDRHRKRGLRRLLRSPRTRALPGIGRILTSRFGYAGHKITRIDGKWSSQEYRFY